MNIPNNTFCPLPWVSLEASPIGTVRPCCLADDEITDDASNKFHLSSANFTEIQNSKHMQSLRQQFLDGKKPQTCRKCWNEERSGRTSKRLHTLNRLKHILADEQWTADAKPLMFLDLKLGNICNLKCRICGSWSSSQFATEEINATEPIKRKQTFAYQMLRAGAWPRENQQFWQQIDSVLSDIRYIEFTGGEPFLIQEHFNMLQGIVDRGIAGQVEIHYNTNGTQYPEHAEEIWKHFKTVEIAVSIDDVGERFEYQRTNAVWTEVVVNLNRFKELRARNKNIQLQCCTTVNVFNVRYLADVANFIVHQGFDFVYWNMLHDAPQFSIATLPKQAKIEIAAYLRNCNPPAEYQLEFKRICEFMFNGTRSDGSALREEIFRVDKRRNQSLESVAPELAELIGYNEKD